MKIVILHYGEIADYPPTRSLIEILLDLGHEVTVISRDRANALDTFCQRRIKVIKLRSYENTKIEKALVFEINKRSVRKKLAELMSKNDLLWLTMPEALRYVGIDILHYKYVLQLMELVENVSKYPILKRPYLPMKEYAQKAYKVVVPEINRAYIQRVWWSLNDLPVILPNKPYRLPTGNQFSDDLKTIITEMDADPRKKILYQGIFSEERNLRAIAEAIAPLQKDVCFYIMGKDNAYRKMLCKKYSFIKYIPFQSPPQHLLITQHADIGLLPYVPIQIDGNSSLNALYCAPNKIYEYAAYGIPMIGSDVLGLVEPFNTYGIGVICRSFSAAEIRKAIKQIINRYTEMKNNCRVFYEQANLQAIVKEILGDMDDR